MAFSPKKIEACNTTTNTAAPNVNIANPTDDVTRVDATNTHDVESTCHDDNGESAYKEVNMDEAAKKDIDADWKPSLNDAHEEHDDDEIEHDEDEPPVCKVCKGAPKVTAASVPEDRTLRRQRAIQTKIIFLL